MSSKVNNVNQYSKHTMQTKKTEKKIKKKIYNVFLLLYNITPFCETTLFNDVHACAVCHKLHLETLG